MLARSRSSNACSLFAFTGITSPVTISDVSVIFTSTILLLKLDRLVAIKTEHPQNQLRRDKIQRETSNNAASSENELKHFKLLSINKKGDWVGNAKKTRPGLLRPSRHYSMLQRKRNQ